MMMKAVHVLFHGHVLGGADNVLLTTAVAPWQGDDQKLPRGVSRPLPI